MTPVLPDRTAAAPLDDRLSAYDYPLPEDRIAQRPPPDRESARLLVHDRRSARTRHRRFADLVDELAPGDLLVLNDTRVVPARLLARRASGGRVEVLLHPTGLEGRPRSGRSQALALLKPSARVRQGEELSLPAGPSLRVEDPPGDELRRVTWEGGLDEVLARGRVPLPPYLEREPDEQDVKRYQTVYARQDGAVAAPTAGLHFTARLLAALPARGVQVARLTLHVGPGTFLPVRGELLSEHAMHEEAYEIPAGTAEAVADANRRGGRVIAVGTTSTRALESAAQDGALEPGPGRTSLFIRPPFEFQVLDALITNFHLPRSTLLALVSAFAGRRELLDLYRLAVKEGYRFYSYGDAMLLT